jgi:hypothetical protein
MTQFIENLRANYEEIQLERIHDSEMETNSFKSFKEDAEVIIQQLDAETKGPGKFGKMIADEEHLNELDEKAIQEANTRIAARNENIKTYKRKQAEFKDNLSTRLADCIQAYFKKMAQHGPAQDESIKE